MAEQKTASSAELLPGGNVLITNTDGTRHEMSGAMLTKLFCSAHNMTVADLDAQIGTEGTATDRAVAATAAGNWSDVNDYEGQPMSKDQFEKVSAQAPAAAADGGVDTLAKLKVKVEDEVPAEPKGGSLIEEIAPGALEILKQTIAKKKADCLHAGHFNDKFKAETTAFFEQLEKEITLLLDCDSRDMAYAGLKKFRALAEAGPRAPTAPDARSSSPAPAPARSSLPTPPGARAGGARGRLRGHLPRRRPWEPPLSRRGRRPAVGPRDLTHDFRPCVRATGAPVYYYTQKYLGAIS